MRPTVSVGAGDGVGVGVGVGVAACVVELQAASRHTDKASHR
jgi:hypothetical protein